MNQKKNAGIPKTQHSRITGQGNHIDNPYVVLDSPDDRITEQNGDGTTIVKNDNPDDLEDKPVP